MRRSTFCFNNACVATRRVKSHVINASEEYDQLVAEKVEESHVKAV